MELKPTAPGKTRNSNPQVLIVQRFRGESEKHQLLQAYYAALPGMELILVEYFERGRDYATRTHIDFVVVSVEWETTENKARKQVSAIWQVCPEAKIILMAREGFNPHDARVTAVIRMGAFVALGHEIRK